MTERGWLSSIIIFILYPIFCKRQFFLDKKQSFKNFDKLQEYIEGGVSYIFDIEKGVFNDFIGLEGKITF